jgi:hypothetical protein
LPDAHAAATLRRVSGRLLILLATYVTLAVLAAAARFLAFDDRPDLHTLAWVPMLLAAIIATPFVLLAP